MPELEAGQTEQTESADRLGDLVDAALESASEEEVEATTEAETETDAGDDSAQSADAAEESPEAPSAESLGLDLKNPKDKAAYGELVKQWAKWTNRFHAKLKQKPAEQPAQPQQEQPREQPQAAAEADDPLEAVYRIDLESFSPELTFREGSDLADYGDELKDLIGQALKQGIQHALNGVRDNDRKLRQQMTVAEREAAAGKTISEYLEEVKDHPDFEEKWPELQKLGQLSRDLAMNDPERWVRLAERELDLPRNWRGQQQAEQQRTGQQNQRLANKPKSIVQRPSRATSAPSALKGNMKFDDALDVAMKQAGL